MTREEFLAAASGLGLSDAELDRLTGELKKLGIRVAAPRHAAAEVGGRPSPLRAAAVTRAATAVHTPTRSRTAHTGPAGATDVGRAAENRSPDPIEPTVRREDLGPRMTAVLKLAQRYVGSAAPASRFVPGLARLCGLDDNETDRLAAALAGPAHVESPVPVHRPTEPRQAGHNATHAERPRPAPSRDEQTKQAGRAATPTEQPAPASPSPTAQPQQAGQKAKRGLEPLPAIPTQPSPPVREKQPAEISAARSLLAERRFLRRPAKRILTAQEETGLTLLMRGWPTTSPSPEPAEEELAALPRSDVRRQAYEALVEHNVGLVHELRKKYTGQGLEDEDLLHHGVLGLMHAVCKFDPARGFKLSTYAYHWIRQAMTRAIADFGSAIRIPVHLHEEMHKVAAAEAKLHALGRAATKEAVAVATGLTVTRVTEIRGISRVTASLDRELFEGANLGDALSYDLPSLGPEELLYPQWSREDIEQRLLAKLDVKSADILRRRSGLIDQEVQTLDAIGSVYGVTRERIRQLETKARNRLKEILTEEEQTPSRPASRQRPERRPRTAEPRPRALRPAAGNDDFSAQGVELAARRMASRLGRTALIRQAGHHGAHIIRAMADGRLSGSAASTRLRRILLEYR
ncbi:sigma-70 family RNA polymerase sigma factor [Streptomyces sp. NBC_00557]|uniref:sigma-70 family RNA polymerase sigma factor n=1 Tax=Streptomyces sp. NBC_00557 TaxID=2975776 RepID=UPI002E81EE19|nr:sigma-70 family RNA polymerase sigma factor [Streptomyces sp. NBC_00557]WUC33771.1 sigma-70 family RNA polymerase sigma factor [Streptomyces sp. NBC_00557]